MSPIPIPESKFPTSSNIRLPKHHSLPELHQRTVVHPVCGRGHCQYDDDGSAQPSALSRPRVRYTSSPPVRLSLIGPHDGPKIQGKSLVMESKTTPLPLGGHKGVPYPESSSAVATATLSALQLTSLKHSHLQPAHKQTEKEALDLQPQLISDCRDPVFDSTAPASQLRLSSSSSRPSSVDRSDSWSSPMTVMKPSRTLKTSRRNIVVGLDCNDTKKPSLHIDNDDHDIFKEIISDDPYDESRETSSKRFSPLPPKLRTIRRRKRLSIGRTSNPDASSVKPIAISLTFSSSATPQIHLPKLSMSALCDRVTYPAEADSASQATFDAPSSPNPSEKRPTQHHHDGSPENRVSASLSSRPSTPLSPSTSFHSSTPVNVRLGHPSRPYYSAIRKQGISPPSSRRSSIKDHASSPTRPKSYSLPSPASKSEPGSPRHLSLSAVPHTSSFISAFSLDDDSDDNVDDQLPMIPLTPIPVSGRMSFGTSLASAAKSLTRKRSKSGPSAFSTHTIANRNHSHSASSPPPAFPLSSAHSRQGSVKGKGFKMSSPTAGSGVSGIGFSVSGETELKMALAFSEAQTGKNDADPNVGISFLSTTTPAIQEEEETACVSAELSPPLLPTSLSLSPISPPSSLHLSPISNSRNSIASRVKRLGQGLKDMLLTTTHGAGNNTNSTTNTTA